MFRGSNTYSSGIWKTRVIYLPGKLDHSNSSFFQTGKNKPLEIQAQSWSAGGMYVFWAQKIIHLISKHLENNPIGSMYDISSYIWLIFMVNVGKYTIHGSYGNRYLEYPRNTNMASWRIPQIFNRKLTSTRSWWIFQRSSC